MSGRRSTHFAATVRATGLAVLLLGCAGAPPATVQPAPSPTSPLAPSPAAPTERASQPPPTATSAPASAVPARGSPQLASPDVRRPAGWEPAVRVSAMRYTEPALLVDRDGFAHVAAVHDGGIFHLTNRTGSWTEQRLSTPPGTGIQTHADGQPSIAEDGDGTLAIAFTRWGPADNLGRLPQGVFYITDRAGAWSTPTLLVDDPEGGHSPSLQLRDGRIHLAYVLGLSDDVIPDDASFPVRYGTAAEGEAWLDNAVAPNGTEPVLRLNADGVPRIMFGDAYGLLEDDGLRVAFAAPDGGFDVEVLPGTSRYALPYDLATAGQKLLAVWSRPGWASSDDRWTAHQQVRDGSWAEAGLLMLDGTVRAAAVTAEGSLHAIGGNLDGIWYGSDAGGPFETVQLSDRFELRSDIAVDGVGRPHVIMLVGESGAEELWYQARTGP